MAEHEFFHPEEIDEQIEQHLPSSSAQSWQATDEAASQAIGDLQRYYAPSEQSVALHRVWLRFSERRAALQSERGQATPPSLALQRQRREKHTFETSEARRVIEPHELPPMRQRRQEESPMQSQQQFSDHDQANLDQSEHRHSLRHKESNIYTAESPYQQGEKLQVREKPGRRKLLLAGVSLASFLLGAGLVAGGYALTQQIPGVQQNPGVMLTPRPPYERLVASANSATGQYQAALYENGTTTYINIVDLTSQKLVNTMPIETAGSLNGMQLYWSQNEKRLLLVSQDGMFQVFQVQYIRLLHTGLYTLKSGQHLKGVLFSADGSSVSILLNFPDEIQTFSIPEVKQ